MRDELDFDNYYAPGTLKWEAWGMGDDYAQTVEHEHDQPLSGEWADAPLVHDVIRETWERVIGRGYNTYAEPLEYARDSDDDILDAWERGYRHAFAVRDWVI